jgi:hypothetical protein
VAHIAAIYTLGSRSAPVPSDVARVVPRHHVGIAQVAMAAAVASLVWALVGTPLSSLEASTAPERPVPFDEIWIGTRTTAETLARFGGTTSHVFLGGSTSFAIGGWGGAVPTASWASVAAFSADLQADKIPQDVRVVMYDPEAWEATPIDEQLDPAAAMRTFGMLARKHGYLVVITPHPNLATVAGAECVSRAGETLEQAFLRCEIQADAARYADVVEIQAQYLETDRAKYEAFVRALAVQARQANPGVLVISGLSTNFTTHPSVLFDAWRSVIGIVDGHYLNVPHGRRPEVAVAFLRMAAAAE